MMDGIELMIAFIFVVIVVVIGINVGNLLGDQATLRDCATKSEARMVSGGTIECTVRKETK